MVSARAGKINRIGLYIVAAILLLLVMTVTLWPRYCRIEKFYEITPTRYNLYTKASTKTRNDFEREVYNADKLNTRTDSKDFFQFLGCYQKAGPTSNDAYINSYFLNPTRYFETKSLTTDEFGDVIESIKSSLKAFSMRCRDKIIKGPVYISLSQVAVTLDSNGKPITNSMFNAPIQNSDDPLKSKIYSPYRKYNTDGTVTERGPVKYNYTIIYDRYDKSSLSTALEKADDVNSFQYSVLTYLNSKYATKNRHCLMTGIGVRGQEVFAGCASDKDSKCLGPAIPNMDEPDNSPQNTTSLFMTIYKINSVNPLIDNSSDKINCDIIKAKGVYTPYDCQLNK